MKKLLLIVALFALSSADIVSDSLALHNNERNAYGVPSLTWSSSLAQTAQSYAQYMASTGTTSHSTNRVNIGENLAWGSGSNINIQFLGGLWLNEKEFYIPGQNFPDCSTTGSWHDVAHYTQLMWEQTTQVGCGLAEGNGRYNYVCHYAPQGNIDGEPVYTVGAAPISSSSSSSPSSSTSGNNQATSTTPVVTTQPVTTTPVTTTPVANAATTTSSGSTGPSPSQPYTYSTSAPDASSSSFIPDCLYAHNHERNNYGIPSLTWSTSLAQTAQSYAQYQASTGSTSHSTGRVNVGENLAWQSGYGTNVEALANRWLNEKRYYIAGQDFPNVSTTGNWESVSHYTQMMWSKTTEVGCGVSQGSYGMYYYVCHYYVQGNIMGQPVYPVGVAPISSSSPSSTSGNNQATGTTPVVTTQPVTTAPTTTSSGSTGPSPSQPYTYSTSAPDASSSSFIPDCLYAHNHERNNYGIPSLTWSTSLAQTAQSYAQYQASTGSTSHSTGRVNVGENLAWQSGYGTTTQALANRWLNEKRYYISGQDFPNVSTTGNWESVSHYTQMMWRKTTQVGCGVSKGMYGMYYYVCHYSVQGNIMGQPVY